MSQTWHDEKRIFASLTNMVSEFSCCLTVKVTDRPITTYNTQHFTSYTLYCVGTLQNNTCSAHYELTSSPLKVKFMSRLPVEAEEDPVSHLETSANTRVSLYFHTMHLCLDRSIGLVAIINIVNTLNRVLVENKHRCVHLIIY